MVIHFRVTFDALDALPFKFELYPKATGTFSEFSPPIGLYLFQSPLDVEAAFKLFSLDCTT